MPVNRDTSSSPLGSSINKCCLFRYQANTLRSFPPPTREGTPVFRATTARREELIFSFPLFSDRKADNSVMGTAIKQ